MPKYVVLIRYLQNLLTKLKDWVTIGQLWFKVQQNLLKQVKLVKCMDISFTNHHNYSTQAYYSTRAYYLGPSMHGA